MRLSVLVLRALSCCENVKKETVFLCSIFGSSSYTETQVIKGSSRSHGGQRFSLLWTELYMCETNVSAIDIRKPIYGLASTYIHTCV